MLVKQLSVFVENKTGRLLKMASVLADNGINLVTLSIADTKDFGILRGITKDNEKALEVLKNAGFTACITELVGVEVDDEPGGMLKLLELFNSEGISIEYLYSFARNLNKKAIILMRVEDTEKTTKMLKEHKMRIITEKDIYGE